MSGAAAFGTVFKIGADAVANLTDVSGPNIAVDSIDVTAHDSADDYREFVAGVIDGGEVSLEGNVTTNAEYKTLLDTLEARDATQSFTIEFPSGTVNNITFNGFFTALETGAPFEDKLTFSATVKVTGKPNLAS